MVCAHHARLKKIEKAYDTKVKRAMSVRARQEKRAIEAFEKKLRR